MLSSWSRIALALHVVPFALTADAQLVEPISKDNSAQCQCYLTSGPDPGYFQYHRFWDFRNIASDGSNDYTETPALLTDADDNGDESVTASYFNTSTFLADWSIQTGQTDRNESIPVYDSARNVYISRNSTTGANDSTYLTLRAQRLASFMSVAEVDSNQMNLLHSSIRVRARIIPNGLSNSSAPSAGTTAVNDANSGSNSSHPVSDGAVFGFFTYHNDQQESDIEVLTSDPTTQIHYSNQPDYDAKTDMTVPGASTELALPNNLDWTEWIEHRIDWFEGVARWYVNGQLVLNKTKNAETDPSGLIMNLWSDGGDWSGNMTVGSQVTVGIEWVDMVFNISGNVDGTSHRKRDRVDTLMKRKESYCEIGCKVDGVNAAGFPEVAYNATSSAMSGFKQSSAGIVFAGSMAILTTLSISYL